MRSPQRERTNEQWLAELRSESADGETVEALREHLRSGLTRALRPQADVSDADLDDFTQDATVRVLSQLASFRGESRFTTWAMAIGIRVAYTTLRRRRWGDRSLEDLGIDADASAAPAGARSARPGAAADRSDLFQALRASIDSDLTPRQRAAVLGELAGMPSAVLAAQLQTNANALYKLNHDARLRLRDALHRRGFSESDVRTFLLEASRG
ncbi:MAG: sigma-70 family RNA polymerase sigma factor [Phycisphaerales bacterium]|nr:sigma-70 family RNA polymerase sigma factor [Phycisphaerae bacterium]NNF43394.1 sigma-70 family RNA polymerase sigma factor [Phycisphaerales bacterium]NNM24975.1 sigma-70 family RNA polymerase sigma factor [Phycisphaerales bacterium]